MDKLKIWERLVVICLTMLFVITLFLTFSISIGGLNITSRFFILGAILIAINIASFFYLVKILLKHYNYKNRKGLRIYFYSMIIIASVTAMVVLLYNGAWQYLLVYAVLDAMYIRIIERTFGKFRLCINAEHEGLLVGDLTSFNTDIKVIAKNKQVKSSTETIKVGDIIRISKDGEPILTLDVIKNKK